MAIVLDDLAEFRWVKIAWRKPHTYLRSQLPDGLRNVEHIATPRCGRYPSTVRAIR